MRQLNTTLHQMFNGSFGSLDEAFDACEAVIKEQITALVKNYLDLIIETFVNSVFDVIDTIIDFAEMLIDWLFDRISLE